MAYEPLHHKYRPQTFSDLVGQETIAQTLSNALKQGKIAPAYLFTGPRGTGKTSSARILAKSLNCLASDRPTPHPCGKCEVCLAIAKGSALDVMEIDAASNTGVDNIREIIERSRFAPVQCRYKIYAIDECLTGDSLILTDSGLMRIDNPKLKDKNVLSYNESKQVWEYKKVLRWLERGTKKTLTIKTGNSQISCTENHLIRTETGWIEAGKVREGMKILSPVNVDVKKNLIFPTFCKNTTTSKWEQNLVENGCQTYNNIQSLQWNTSLERVESVSHGVTSEKVYDLEVEDHHNFVANGLLVHNCHMLSTAAFNALLKTLEEPPPQVVFILATTDPQRVLSTIISRCQRFDYRRIPLKEMTSHLRFIANAEEIAIADDALTLVAQISNGGLRDAESLLDQLSLLPETITVEKVWDLVGAVPEQDLLKLLQAINDNDSLAVLQQCRSLLDRGREPLVVLQNLATFYLNLLIAKTAPQHAELTAVTETCWQQLCVEAKNWQTVLILRGQQHLKEAETQLKRTTQPRLWLEVTLLGLLPEVHSAITPSPQVVAPTAINPAVTTPPAIASTPTARPQNTPTTTSATPPQQNHVATPAVTQSSAPPQQPIEPPPQPVAQQSHNHQPTAIENNISKVSPQAVASSTNQDPAANQQIWNKVLECLQPPMTKALLEQHCILVSFDNSSAIVGISSAKLQKLHQGKVPNIETAFKQVCQRKVRVQLEVASSQGSKTQNYHGSTNQSVAQTPRSAPEQPPNPPPPASTQVVQQLENAAVKPPSIENQHQITTQGQSASALQSASAFQTPPIKSFNYNAQVADKLPEVAIQNTSVLTSPNISADVSVENNVALPSKPTVSTDELVLEQNYADSELEQAIANLTQSFEGEVVQLNNADNTLNDYLENNDSLSDSEVPIPLDRPDVEEYDDDW